MNTIHSRRALAGLLLVWAAVVGAQTVTVTTSVEVKPELHTAIDWTGGTVVVTGLAPLQDGLPASAQLPMMRRVATVDAYRQLAEAINGVRITSETTVAAFKATSDVSRTTVDAVLRGFKVLSEGFNADRTIYQVTIGIALAPQAGFNSSLAQAVMPTIGGLDPRNQPLTATGGTPTTTGPGTGTGGGTTPGATPVFVAPRLEVPTVPPPAATALPPRKPGPYTGLVLDATGFELQRCMAPKIYRKDGTELWGTAQVSRDFVQNQGIAGWAPSLEAALSPFAASRVGDNPLVVRAIGRQGSVFCNAVVGDDDADLIVAENAKTRFLEKFRVMFVVGK